MQDPEARPSDPWERSLPAASRADQAASRGRLVALATAVFLGAAIVLRGLGLLAVGETEPILPAVLGMGVQAVVAVGLIRGSGLARGCGTLILLATVVASAFALATGDVAGAVEGGDLLSLAIASGVALSAAVLAALLVFDPSVSEFFEGTESMRAHAKAKGHLPGPSGPGPSMGDPPVVVQRFLDASRDGGLAAYYEGPVAREARHLPGALRTVGALETAELVGEANALFGADGPPVDGDERRFALSRMRAADRQALARLQIRLDEVGTEADRRLQRYPRDADRG